MREYWKTFFNAVLAGLFIGIAGTVYLMCPFGVLGAFLFGFGLLTIVCNNFKLFTGAVGYLAVQGKKAPEYLVSLLLIWGGNLVGCFAVGEAVRNSRINAAFIHKVTAICQGKINDSWGSLLILAFFCGILMYLAVSTYRDNKTPLGIMFCIPVFILSGFEHSIADIFYFAASGIVSLKAFVFLWLVILGNSIGGMLLPVINGFWRKKQNG